MKTSNKAAIKLPFDFNVQRLQAELTLLDNEWEVSLTPRTEPGTYWIINLMTPDLEADRVDGILPFKWHPALDNCPYLMEVLNTFPCRFQRVMIRKLMPGKGFTKHRDPMYYEKGEVRIHVPIVTDDLFEIYFNDERVIMPEGECWYLNTRLIHWGINKSENDRVHLIMDCDVDDWMENLFVNLGFPPQAEAKKALFY